MVQFFSPKGRYNKRIKMFYCNRKKRKKIHKVILTLIKKNILYFYTNLNMSKRNKEKKDFTKF